MRNKIITLFLMVVLVAVAAWAVPTVFIGTAAINSNQRLVSNRPVKLYALLGVNTNNATQYIQLFTTTVTLTNLLVPKISAPVGAGQYYYIDFGTYGADFDVVNVANSTTPDVLTIGSTNCSFQAIIAQ